MEPQSLTEHTVEQLLTALRPSDRQRVAIAELRAMARAHDEDPDEAVRQYCERRLEQQYFDTEQFLPPAADPAFY
ncbi:hypothetical protein [Halosimplex carlsbadense]|uniref:hypothetical protein n=1 Tax=Halosimplex carlsbadense TaxID=171164 RepID=UPI001378FDB5|nr:hypothetical protein [Halosimplex carlsbadense]